MSVLNIVISRCRSCDSVVRVRAVSKQNEKIGEKEKKRKREKGRLNKESSGRHWKRKKKKAVLAQVCAGHSGEGMAPGKRVDDRQGYVNQLKRCDKKRKVEKKKQKKCNKTINWKQKE